MQVEGIDEEAFERSIRRDRTKKHLARSDRIKAALLCPVTQVFMLQGAEGQEDLGASGAQLSRK
eukprot:13046171-Alexandrium_andersonii.AAC.1